MHLTSFKLRLLACTSEAAVADIGHVVVNRYAVLDKYSLTKSVAGI